MSGMDEHDHRMAVPLGPEMEAKWRESVRFLADTENLQWSNDAMARVMATLDVCRAEAVAVLDVERLAEALANLDVDGESTPVEIIPYKGESSDNYMEHRLGAARKIAAAYARFTRADEDSP